MVDRLNQKQTHLDYKIEQHTARIENGGDHKAYLELETFLKRDAVKQNHLGNKKIKALKKEAGDKIFNSYNPYSAMGLNALSVGANVWAAQMGVTGYEVNRVAAMTGAGTGLSSLAGIPTNSGEATRQREQLVLQELNDKEEAMKSAKQGDKEGHRNSIHMISEADKNEHDAMRAVLGG